MDLFQWSVIVFFLVSVVLIMFVSKAPAEDEQIGNSGSINELRSRQIKGLREHSVKRKFEDAVTKRAKNKKKYDIEQMLMRAGLSQWSYGEYIITKLGISGLACLLSTLFFGNLIVVLLATFIAYLIPGNAIQIISNKRTEAMEQDIGSFIQLTSERYNVHGDFQLAVRQSAEDFIGHEPMSSEIKQTILDFNVGTPTAEAMTKMGQRTGSKFILQLANYYEIAAKIGTEESRQKILGQAYVNFDEDYKMKKQHEMEIDGPKKDAYMIVGAMPLLVLYQASVDETYIDFFLNTGMGRAGLTAIILTIVGTFIFINKKIGAPLD